MLKDIVDGCYDGAHEKQKADGYIVLKRSLATIPLAGIDVPPSVWPTKPVSG
jgi:hypothetical protein